MKIISIEKLPDGEAWYYPVSDDVPEEIITACTVTCDRMDCCLSANIKESTLMGTLSYYSKFGAKKIEDNNRFEVHVCCQECWQGWKVNT